MIKKIQFPDPNVEQEFEAPNGKTYVWNGFAWELVCGGTDVSGFVTKKEFEADQDRQDDEIQDVKDNYLPLAGGTMVGEIRFSKDVPFNGITVYGPDGKGYNNNQDKVFEVGNGSVYTDPFVNLGVEPTLDNHATTKKYVDDLDEKLWVDQDRQDKELADEIQARAERDLLHDAQIDTIEYKLEALIGVTFRGTYEFKHDQSCEEEYQKCISNCPDGDARCESDCARAYSECEENSVEPGFFEAIDPDGQFDNLQEIIISKNDKSNVEIDWAGVLDKDDYLEVDHVLQGQLDKTNYGLYRILEEPEAHTNSKGDVVYVMKLQFLQGDGVLNEKEMYEIRGITAAEGVNPEELGDFLTKTDAAATYLPLIGGTLTGNLMMNGSSVIKTRHLDSGNNSDLQIKRNGSRRILVGTDKIIFDMVPTFGQNPSNDNHLTRKKWVSDNFASAGHSHSNYASSSHNHDSRYVKGNFTITKSNGNYYIS